MKIKFPPSWLALRLVPFAALLTQTGLADVPSSPVRESEQKQVQIQGETKQLIAALDGMLDEYSRNNLSGEDVAVVRRLRQSLESLSAAEMRQVVDLLQKARSGNDPDAAVKSVADAFTMQKQIIVAIKRILAEHAREQEAGEISRQLHELADRQARNLQNGIELGRMTAGARPENFEALYQAQLETQRAEQAAIADELRMVRGKVERFAAAPENADVAASFKAAAAQLERVEPLAAGAAESLKAGQIFKAATDEKTSREELRKVARHIAPRERGPEALRKAERELAEVIADQRQVKDSTAMQRTQPDFEKWLADKLAANDQTESLPSKFRNQPASALRQNKEIQERFEKEQREKGAQLARIEDQQGELAGKADALAQNVAEMPQVAAGLKKATEKMQEARAAMQDSNVPQAVKQQEDTLARLDAAHAELKRRADEAEMLAANSGDKLKDLEQLQKIAEELARQEAAIAKNPKPDAAAQADIARRANQLAQRAPASAPKSAQPAQAAANNAKQSEQAMQAGNAAEGRAEAQQAAQNLAEAAKQIAQELANAQAAQQQAADARAALAGLAKIIEAEQALELETAKASALVARSKPAPFAELATRQGEVQKDAASFKATLDASAPAASQAIGDATADMGKAAAQLSSAQGPAARQTEQQAIEKLLAAQKALGEKLEQAQAALGQPMNANDAAQMAQAAAQMQQAQQQIQQAQANLQQAAQQSGQQAAQNAATAAQQAAQAAQQAAQAAQAAQQQAAQAGNQQAAQQAGQAAQQAAAAAQAAQQAAQNAQQMANAPAQQTPQAAQQAAEQAAQQAGQAAQAAQQAATAAQNAQQAAQQGAQQAAQAGQQAAQTSNQQAAQQAGQAAQSAQQAAQAATQAQQMAQAAAQAAQQGAQQAAQSMQQASQQLAQAAQSASQATAQQGGQMSPSAQQAAQQAAQQLSSATGQAMSGQTSSAQQSAQAASQSLAQAQASMAAMQAGLSPSQGGTPMPGSQGQGQGQGQKGQGTQPGQGKGSGPSSQASNQPSQGAESYKPGDPQAVQRGERQAALKKADFIGLPPRERAAILQSLREKYPEEYGSLVEQYLLNLSTESVKK